MQCATHPHIETFIKCSKCEKPICYQCMVETPVGYRCHQCAQLRRLPQFTAGPTIWLQAVAAAVALAFAGGILWAVIKDFGGFGGFLLILAAIAIGYGISEGISRAARGKRPPSLAIIAGVSAAASFIVGNVLLYVFFTNVPFSFALRHAFDASIWDALAALLAVGVAYSRLKVS